MQVERYVPALHSQALMTWLGWRDREMPDNYLPKVGFVVDGLAAGFLYQTDSRIAEIETLVTNPKADKQQRSDALDLIVAAIIDEARALGFELLNGTTTAPAIVERARKHGFEVDEQPYTLVTKVL